MGWHGWFMRGEDMSSAIQDRVISATGACLRPIARVLLRCGVSYRQFADMAKEAFIEEALSERDSRGRRANTSRVSVRTGISRKEVARFLGTVNFNRDALQTMLRYLLHWMLK